MSLGWWMTTLGWLVCVMARPVVETSECWDWSPWCSKEGLETTAVSKEDMEAASVVNVTVVPMPSRLQSGDNQDAKGVFATSRGGDRLVDASNNVSFIHFGSAALSVGTIILMVGVCALVGYCAIKCRGQCLSAVEEATSVGRQGQQQQPISHQVQPSSQAHVQQLQQPAIMAPTEAFLMKAFDKMGGGRSSGRYEERRRNNRDRDQFDYLRRSGRYDNDIE